VRRAADRKQHDWSELAIAPETNSLLATANSYTGAQLRGLKPEDNSHVGNANSYIGASNVGLKSSTEDNVSVGANVRSVPDSYIVGQPWARRDVDVSGTRPESSTESDMRDDTNVRAVPEAYIRASTARLESSTGNNVARRKSSTGNDVHVDASGAESKPSTGNMYVAAEHRRTSRYIQETCYDDAVTSEFETGKTLRQHRRLPETREDNEQASVMKDDRSSSERRSSRRREKTGSVLQLETDTGQTVYARHEPETGQTAHIRLEPDTGQTAYTPRWQKTGSAMQMESRDPRSRPIPTACIPPSLATQQPEGDRRTALPSLQLKTTSMPEDSARPAGHTVAQQQEEEMAVERKLAALQLGDTVDRFLPELQTYNFRHKPETEIAELHQRLIEQLQKLTADLNQRLTSGLHPTSYIGHDRPPTQIVAAEPEIQRPEMQLYDRYSDANSAYHYRPSFYSPPGYTQCVYPNGVQYGVVGVPCPSQEVETRQVDKVLPEQQSSKGFFRQPEIDGNAVAQPNPESRQDATVKIPTETSETGSAELETVGTVSGTTAPEGKSENGYKSRQDPTFAAREVKYFVTKRQKWDS